MTVDASAPVHKQIITTGAIPLPRRAGRTRPAKSVTIVHDYLTQRGGAERVVLALLKAFPGANLVTSFYNPGTTFPEFAEHDITVLGSGLAQSLYQRDPRLAFFRLGKLFQEHTINSDIVICSSSGWSHAVKTTGKKIVYCHNPARWIYQSDDYFVKYSKPVRRIAELLLSTLKRRDRRWAESADAYIANSSAVLKRISKAYNKDADVIFPPAGLAPDGDKAPINGIAPGYFLTVSRARAYKNTEAICDAVAMTADARLVVVGGRINDKHTTDGRIVGVSGISDAQLRWLYSNCSAVVAVGQEDFGLTPVEGYLFGKPVIALRAGGYLDSTVENITGIFTDNDSADAISQAMETFTEEAFDDSKIRRHGQSFTTDQFGANLHEVVAQVSR